jgi:hypothetical protein
MKNHIIKWSIVFASILVIAILFVALSPSDSNIASESTISQDYTRSVTFATGDNSFTFDSIEIYKPYGLKDILYAADILALNCETYSDSSIVRPIGRLKNYKFTYHYVYVMSGQTKFHGIIVRDTITDKEVYVTRYDKFIDNITIFKELNSNLN